MFKAHLDVGDHIPGKLKMEFTFDRLRREWAEKFLNIDQVKNASADSSTATASKSTGSTCKCDLPLEWVLQSPRRGPNR